MQIAPLANDNDGEVICPMFDLPVILRATPDTLPPPPYIRPDEVQIAHWTNRVGNDGRRRIGIAWSTKFDETTEHPNARRAIPLDQFLGLLNAPPDCELWSLQTQECKEAMTSGIHAPHYQDFADVVAIVSLMDAIVSIDTAALHIAGAIGHSNVYALLPYAATWRWVRNDWYPRLKRCQQTSPGNWPSAFQQLGRL